jgi:hypothetical protein
VLTTWPTASFLSSQEKPDPPLFVGETLHYAMTILGIPSGELILSASAAQLNGQATYKLQMSALTNTFFSQFFLVREHLTSWIDPKSLRSLRFEKHAVEGRRVRDELVEFDYRGGIARMDGIPVPLEDASLDSLSSVYYLRTVPLDGDPPIELPVFSEEPRLLRVEVQARETVSTPAGTFQTIRVEPKSAGEGLIANGKNLILWLSDDERRIPVQIRSRLKVGTLVGRLISIERTAVLNP